MQKVDELGSPPVVGKFYLVPCVEIISGRTGHRKGDWVPIRGVLHDDADLDFPFRHYHYDWRFLSSKEFDEYADRLSAVLNIEGPAWSPGGVVAPQIQYKRRKCQREEVIARQLPGLGQKIAPVYQGQSWGSDKVCPHKGTRLQDCPVRDSRVTCPLHGLQFDAASGEIFIKEK